MWWLLAIEILVLTTGFVKLSTIGLNRLLSTPRSKRFIGTSELAQLILITMYFVYFVCRLGQSGTIQFFDTSASNTLLRFETILVLLGSVGFVLLLRSTMAFQFYLPPKCQIENDSKIIDLRRLQSDLPWQQTLVGPRPVRAIALLPGNEQFQVEISTKTYSLPRLPDAWDGLSLVHFTDTHFRGAVTRRFFEVVCEHAAALQPDLFVFTGDLLDDQALLSWLPETLGRLKAPLGQYFILGNHDWHQNPPEIRREFERLGWTDLAGRSQELRWNNSEPPIIIAGDETPWMGSHPALQSDSNDRFHILLSHTPDNIDWAREHGIDLMLAGHTHGGQIRLPFLGPLYSPSRFGCRFASGVFWLEPTLLYVSRGLSGREPIRYLCPPELTKLILKSDHPAA